MGPLSVVRGAVDGFLFKTDLDQFRHDVFGRCVRPVPARIHAAMKVGYALLDLHPEVLAETYIAFDHVAHVADLVAEHERALDAHAEGKT